MPAPDPLTPATRGARLAQWGPPTAEARHMAEGIAARVRATTGPPREAPRHVGSAGAGAGAAARAGHPAIGESRLGGTDRDALARIAPLLLDDDARRGCSLGKSYPDLLAARGERLERAADAVARPRTEAELERLVAEAAERDVTLVPVGGGTSVVGGIEPIASRAGQPVVAVDMAALSTCIDVDPVAGVATFEAGVRGPQAERALARWDRTVGHVPQSFELATLGGWIATRSAGQQSLLVGKVEQLVADLRVVTPSGILQPGHVPAHGAGPDLVELVLGSEGRFGIVSRATVRMRRRPERVRFATYAFGTFEEAAAASRELVRSGRPLPAMLRISDAEETAFNLATAVPGVVADTLGPAVARALGWSRGVMVIAIFVGEADRIDADVRCCTRFLRERGGRSMGPLAARKWYRARFHQPYARDLLMDAGLMVDTLETSAPWGQVPVLREAVREALADALGHDRCVVGCHLSHLYHDGASAYFTFLAPVAPGTEMDRWRAAKQATHRAIASCGGAPSHQHGVGTMHVDLYRDVTPSLGVDALRAVRERLDPRRTINPGKLLELPADGLPALNAAVPAESAGGHGSRTDSPR